MHIKSNIELNLVHFATLAICPLLMIFTTVKQTAIFVGLTLLCYFCSTFVCFCLGKVLSRKGKIVVTALISVIIITILNFVCSKYVELKPYSKNENFYVVLSTIILTIDVYYINIKNAVFNYGIRVMFTLVSFVLLSISIAFVVEPFGYGSICEKKMGEFTGIEFFRSPALKFLLLGTLAGFGQLIYKFLTRKTSVNAISYRKYVKQIRDEKSFQYDNLRRKKLLDSEIDVRKINFEEAENVNENLTKAKTLDEKKLTEDTESNVEDFKEELKKKVRVQKGKTKDTKIEQVFKRKNKTDEEVDE